tara:strand:- start:35341 stop:35727 length:387 start_codon:yes stop_codon:yes gene_type:complete
MIEKLLADRGLRPTNHRLKIGQKVLKEHCHFTADDLCEWASSGKQKMSRATVYNILNEFVAAGLLKSFYSGAAGKTIYDSNLSTHFHLYDVESKKIMDVDPKMLSIDTKNLKGYKVEQMEILITGRKR